MNIAIVGIDSRGGIQPYLGLALGLQRAGHGVRLVVPSNASGDAEAAQQRIRNCRTKLLVVSRSNKL